MKKIFLAIIALFAPHIFCYAEEIHFDNEVYKLKYSAPVPKTNGYGNEYFRNTENAGNWTKMIGVYYYPEEQNPVKFAGNFDKIVENTENSVLLKLIENKKSDKAAISFLVNGRENARNYFEYDIYKFEKNPDRGMMAVKYAEKYYFTNNSEINKIAETIKKNNDKYIEIIIASPVPLLIEKETDIRD